LYSNCTEKLTTWIAQAAPLRIGSFDYSSDDHYGAPTTA
jgi:hypothetical protein